MKKIILHALVLISCVVIGYIIGAIRVLPEKFNTAQVEIVHELLIKSWGTQSNLMISEPIPYEGYEETLKILKSDIQLWSEHPYHTTSSFIDIFSASPKSSDCCDMPDVGEEVRFLTASLKNTDGLDVLVQKNGNVIIYKATINIPSMAW